MHSFAGVLDPLTMAWVSRAPNILTKKNVLEPAPLRFKNNQANNTHEWHRIDAHVIPTYNRTTLDAQRRIGRHYVWVL